MANRNLLHKSKLTAFEVWLVTNGWTLEDPKGELEVLRARKDGRKAPLIIYDQLSSEHYSVQNRDAGVVRAFIKYGFNICPRTQNYERKGEKKNATIQKHN